MSSLERLIPPVAPERSTQQTDVVARAHELSSVPSDLAEPRRPTSEGEELANAATAGAVLVLAMVGAAVLVVAAGSRGAVWQAVGCTVYALTLVTLHGASTLSHLFRRGDLRHGFRIADQALIYLFIAASYTPIALTWLREGSWWVLHALMWGVALAGFFSKCLFAHRVRLGSVSAGLYLLLGWMPIAAAWPIAAALPGGLLRWVLAGGLCYTAGIFFFCFDHRFRYFHAAWHLLVLAGAACHYFGILFYCTSPPPGV